MRISDWSSDVCSSDLKDGLEALRHFHILPLRTASTHRSGRPRPSTPGSAVRVRRAAVPCCSRSTGAAMQRCRGRTLCSSIRSHRCGRSEEHTSELQSLMRNSYAVFCVKKKKTRETRDRSHMKKRIQTRHLVKIN